MILFLSYVHKFDLMKYLIDYNNQLRHLVNTQQPLKPMANNTLTWGDLSNEEREFYAEFYIPIVNNVREIPQNNDPVPVVYRPTDAQINAVCDTGDRLCRTINYRLTRGQHNAIVAYITRFLPNHPDPVLQYVNDVNDIPIQ